MHKSSPLWRWLAVPLPRVELQLMWFESVELSPRTALGASGRPLTASGHSPGRSAPWKSAFMLPFLFHCSGRARGLSQVDDWGFLCGLFCSPALFLSLCTRASLSSRHAHDQEHLQSLAAYPGLCHSFQRSPQTAQVLFWLLPGLL